MDVITYPCCQSILVKGAPVVYVCLMAERDGCVTDMVGRTVGHDGNSLHVQCGILLLTG